MYDIKTAQDFRDHISEKRFTILKQPIVCAETGAVLHHEWLVRFDAEQGIHQIIRPAEINGAISDLDISMLTQAISALNRDPDRLPIAINLSGASLSVSNFEETLFSALAMLKAPTKKLKFELTETWELRDLQPAIRLLTILRDRGHELCLDDVGAGAASLRYLRALPADWIKIDADFVAGAATNKREEAVLNAVLSLRRPLNMKFIAEGIESRPLKEFAINMGFDALQGFSIGAPELEN